MAVLGFSEPNCDWLRILMSRKSFSGSSSQTLFFGGDKRQPEIRLRPCQGGVPGRLSEF